MGTRGDTCVHTRAADGVAEVIILNHEARPARDLGGSFLAATLLGAEQVDTGAVDWVRRRGKWVPHLHTITPHVRLLSAHHLHRNICDCTGYWMNTD